MRIEFVHCTVPNSHKYLRATLARIVAFCKSLDSDADPERMYTDCAANYFFEDPGLVMLAGIDDNNKVVAHLVASMDNYFDGKFVTILQCWKDSNVKDFDMAGKHGLVERLKTWARANGAKDVRTWARNETIAQILEGYDCGFERSEKVLLSVPV